MPVSAQDTVFYHIANGVTVTFAFGCQVLQAADLKVYVNDSLVTSGFAISGIGVPTGGTVSFNAAPPALAQVRIERDIVLERQNDYQKNGDFHAQVVNLDFNRLWMALQQHLAIFNRTLLAPKSESTPIPPLPNIANRAGKLLSFDQGGKPIAVLPFNSESSFIGWIQGGIGAIKRTLQEKLAENISVLDFGAVGNGVDDDTAAIQRAIDAAGPNGVVHFPKTETGIYRITSALKFEKGQKWYGSGGTNVLAGGTQIRLDAPSTSVIEPKSPATTTYYFKASGIYFNAQSFADSAVNLYNCSYCRLDQFAASANKDGAAAILLDSNVGLQCYFNILQQPRLFATGVGGVGIRFVRGANANQVIGGKCGSSTRGMEFLSQSAGNLVIGTDFENNTDRHIYVDAPNNVFIGTHMESVPIGFDITANGSNTQRMNTSFATSVVVNVQDVSRVGTVLDTRIETSSTKGDLRFGPAKFLSELLSTVTRLDYDPDLIFGTSHALVRFFLRTNTTGDRKILLYKGNGTSNVGIELNAATGGISMADLAQDQGNGVTRRIVRRNAVPTSESWNNGDIVFFTAPVAGGKIGAVCIVTGTPGTWKLFGVIAA